ncbi:MAG: hypothetical protein KDA65_01110 [Planctomycetaceae bacterium]|nr:hypothetical protein [Planctomycetaceae bacterium]
MEKSKTAADFFKSAENDLDIPETNVSTIDLEVVTLHRPVGDPLLGDQLWNEVDEMSALIDVEMRKSLGKNGIRVGVVGSSYPTALEELLGMTTDEQSLLEENEVGFVKLPLTIRSGGEAEIDCSLAKSIQGIRIPMLDGDEISDFPENSYCKLRITPRRIQDGWIKMEILPEIHHGEKAFRPTGNLTGWDQKYSQRILPIFSQRFEVELNVGEMVIITSEGDNPHSMGHHFFRSHQEAGDMQRLTLIRLAQMNKSTPVIKSTRVVR